MDRLEATFLGHMEAIFHELQRHLPVVRELGQTLEELIYKPIMEGRSLQFLRAEPGGLYIWRHVPGPEDNQDAPVSQAF
jgi:hypothetical protein